MGLKVTYEHPDFDKGHEFSVNGLGILKNGEATEISDEQERTFVATNQASVRDALKGNGAFTVEGTASVKESDLDELLGVDVSSTPSPDPTAMNVGPDGKKFEHSNLAGARTDEWEGPTLDPAVKEEVAAQVAATASEDTPAPTDKK
jgi:hypothetical protein